MPLMQGRVLASGIMVPVNVDTDGNLQVDILASLPAGTNEIGAVQAREYGWDGAAWRKQPQALGYSGIIGEALSNTSLAAGANSIDSAAVPAGQVWVVENVIMRYDGTVAAVILGMDILRGATTYRIFGVQPPVTTVWYDRQGAWTLTAADKLRLRILGATLNDDAYLQYSGRYITVNA